MNEQKKIIDKKAHKSNTRSENAKVPDSGRIPTEIGGRDGLEPTRYKDWERNGRCIDF